MNFGRWIAYLCLLLFALQPRLNAEVVERIVAVINNDIITLSELDDMVKSVQGDALASIKDSRAREQKRQEFRRSLLDQMIDQRLLTQQYDKLQITATEQDIDNMVDAICKQNNISNDTLKAELQKQGISYTEYRDQMRQHILQTKFIEQQIRSKIVVSEEDVKSLYTKKLGELSEDEVVELTGVQVAIVRSAGPESIEAARKLAEAVREQLVKGVSPDEIARQSADGSIEALTDMGSFHRGELMEELDSAVFALRPGEVTQPIEAPQAMYVLKVKSLGKQANAKPYEEVRDQLYRRLFDQQLEIQLQNFVRNARKEAHVEVLL